MFTASLYIYLLAFLDLTEEIRKNCLFLPDEDIYVADILNTINTELLINYYEGVFMNNNLAKYLYCIFFVLNFQCLYASQIALPEAFGAKGDGVSDDTASIQNAINSLGSDGGTVQLSKRYLIDSDNLTLKANVSLYGRPGVIGNPSPKGNQALNEEYVNRGSVLLINPKYRILMLGNTAIEGCMLWRKGLVIPVEDCNDFAGTAVEIKGEDCYIGKSLIVGFDLGVFAKNQQRVRIEFLQVDCNNGVWIDDSWDIATIKNCHFWPFASAKLGKKNLLREGAAYRFTGPNDGTKVLDCFSFGYRYGYKIEGGAGMTLNGCFADGLVDLEKEPHNVVGTVGYYITGYCRDIRLIACEAWSRETGFKFAPVDLYGLGENPIPLTMVGCKTEQVCYGVSMENTELLMSGTYIRGLLHGKRYGTGITVGNKSDLQITGSKITGYDLAIKADSKEQLQISNIKYVNCNREIESK